jgi:hypothetical protein
LERISDIFALERKARLASERSEEACAGLQRKSKNIGWRKGEEVSGDGFHAAFLICAVAGFRSLAYTCAGVLLPRA